MAFFTLETSKEMGKISYLQIIRRNVMGYVMADPV